MKYFAGCDSGSTYTKAVVIDENGKLIPIYGTKYQYFDAASKPALDKMLQDMEALGFTPYVASSYRTYSYQSQLFNTKAFGIFMEMGYTNADYDKSCCRPECKSHNRHWRSRRKRHCSRQRRNCLIFCNE